MQVRYVLFDLGRVVLDWEPDRLYKKLIPDEEARKDFLSHICNMEWHTRHDGGVSFADNANALIADHPEHESLIRAWGNRFMEMFDGYIDSMPELLERLAVAGVPLYALSNMPSELWPKLPPVFPHLKMFKDVVVSGDEKCVKPGREIFDIALTRMGNREPQSVLFIDDSLNNVEAAAALGFNTHHFKSARGLETALIGLKLI